MSASSLMALTLRDMGKKKEEQSIFVDSVKLRRLIRRSLFAMHKCDRPIYGAPALRDTRDVISDFVIAYEFPEEKKLYMKKLVADFAVLKVDLEAIMEDNVILNADIDKLRQKPEALRTEIYRCIANIDEGIDKWRKSCKGKPGIDV